MSEDEDQEQFESFSPDADEAEYVQELDMRNLPYGRINRICRSVRDQLDVGPHKWYRRGAVGGGRCLLSAFLGARSAGGAKTRLARCNTR